MSEEPTLPTPGDRLRKCVEGAIAEAEALRASILEGESVRDGVRFANRAAALAVTRRGAAPSMPGRDELDRRR